MILCRFLREGPLCNPVKSCRTELSIRSLSNYHWSTNWFVRSLLLTRDYYLVIEFSRMILSYDLALNSRRLHTITSLINIWPILIKNSTEFVTSAISKNKVPFAVIWLRFFKVCISQIHEIIWHHCLRKSIHGIPLMTHQPATPDSGDLSLLVAKLQ